MLINEATGLCSGLPAAGREQAQVGLAEALHCDGAQRGEARLLGRHPRRHHDAEVLRHGQHLGVACHRAATRHQVAGRDVGDAGGQPMPRPVISARSVSPKQMNAANANATHGRSAKFRSRASAWPIPRITSGPRP